ncbi:MAG: hypothetical protein HY746_09265 [Elusimicrobia bacterium]|nr:hypothetical protein [Elusimicrobiota bacterium]
MKLFKSMLAGVICGCFLTMSFAGSLPRAVEQLKDAAGNQPQAYISQKELSGAELQNLKGADYSAYQRYLTVINAFRWLTSRKRKYLPFLKPWKNMTPQSIRLIPSVSKGRK